MKNKRLKRAAGILLSTILILGSFAGCTKKDGGTEGSTSSNGAGENQEGTAMGRFLEEDVELPIVLGNIYDVKKLEDGAIRMIGDNGDNGNKEAWDSKDNGDSWEKAYDFPEELQDADNGYIDYGALSEDGQAVFVYNKIGDSGIKPVIYVLDKEGKASVLPFEIPQGGEGMMALAMDIQFLGNDQLLIRDINGTVYQVSTADGSVKQTYEFESSEEEVRNYAVGKRMLATIGTEPLSYDTESGEQQSTEEVLQKSLSESGNIDAVSTLDGGESLYYLTSKGLYHYQFGGNVAEQVIDGGMNSLGAPAFYPIALTMIDEQSLLIAANDENSESPTGIALLKYTYSPDIPAKPEKELKVYSLRNNRELGQSISRFQKENPDIYVNYQVALSEESGMTVSDALKTLTTEIMAGKGPDLILLDGMPVDTYIEKGILRDLSPVLKESEGNYYENIINAYKDDEGQLCAVPARFKIPMAHGGGKDYTPGEDFDTFTSRQGVLAGVDPKILIDKFWYTCGASWKKEDGTLDASKITEFLTKMKNAYGEYDKSIEEDERTLSYAYANNEGIDVVRLTSLNWGEFDLAAGKVKVNTGLYESQEYGMLNAVNEKLENGDWGLMPGQSQNVFVPSMIVGVSSKSAQPETAEQFAKYLFSPEAQKVSQRGGFPVEKESFLSVIDGHEYEGMESMISGGSAGNSDVHISYAMEPTPQEEIQRMTEMVESLVTPALGDDVIKEAVSEQGEKVLKGEISPEEATEAIMQKINIYLAE